MMLLGRLKVGRMLLLVGEYKISAVNVKQWKAYAKICLCLYGVSAERMWLV